MCSIQLGNPHHSQSWDLYPVQSLCHSTVICGSPGPVHSPTHCRSLPHSCKRCLQRVSPRAHGPGERQNQGVLALSQGRGHASALLAPRFISCVMQRLLFLVESKPRQQLELISLSLDVYHKVLEIARPAEPSPGPSTLFFSLTTPFGFAGLSVIPTAC